MGQLGVVLGSYSIYSIFRLSVYFLTSYFPTSLRLFFPPLHNHLYRRSSPRPPHTHPLTLLS
ncbi:hypothetical protein BO99DRAFT_407799 [Aspergillus violaceofuscus CBS 115571]|uniref:Uncharacterized protein n=1 Tax=Aspergillus violaceofuscus (strain CBS 115571) TaxID=1450538 RepID=A0A2V5HB26_ASPV1|nr:hypothetical protein BO99DRAFT_407799 [Aspergillus violaceofuscus CBS 115571]